MLLHGFKKGVRLFPRKRVHIPFLVLPGKKFPHSGNRVRFDQTILNGVCHNPRNYVLEVSNAPGLQYLDLLEHKILDLSPRNCVKPFLAKDRENVFFQIRCVPLDCRELAPGLNVTLKIFLGVLPESRHLLSCETKASLRNPLPQRPGDGLSCLFVTDTF